MIATLQSSMSEPLKRLGENFVTLRSSFLFRLAANARPENAF